VEATIYIEIPVKVTFSIDPGQRGIFDQAPRTASLSTRQVLRISITLLTR
jgi:hypothetical protein